MEPTTKTAGDETRAEEAATADQADKFAAETERQVERLFYAGFAEMTVAIGHVISSAVFSTGFRRSFVTIGAGLLMRLNGTSLPPSPARKGADVAELIINPAKRALISDSGQYRYWLHRTWDESKPRITWIMLNPSTADAYDDDPTIRRCMGFARSWDAGGISVVNLFAFRATNPNELWRASDPIGSENNWHIKGETTACRIIAAWGCLGATDCRDSYVCEMLANRPMECLGVTKHGHPKHPLYVSAATRPVPFRITEGGGRE